MVQEVLIEWNRVEAVAKAIKMFGINAILKLEENDPQYIALKRIYEYLGSTNATCLLAVCNALISYRLSIHGEEYWMEFSEYILSRSSMLEPDSIVDTVLEFLYISKGNRVLREQKAARLRRFKLSGRHKSVFYECGREGADLRRLNVIIADGVGADVTSKTIVFAVKMAYYVLRISGIQIIPPMDITIPVDRRIALLAYTSGMVKFRDYHPSNIRLLESRLISKANVLQSVWDKVSILSGIPPLNIDSLVWVISKGIGREPKQLILKQALNHIIKILGGSYVDKTLTLLKELFIVPLPER